MPLNLFHVPTHGGPECHTPTSSSTNKATITVLTDKICEICEYILPLVLIQIFDKLR